MLSTDKRASLVAGLPGGTDGEKSEDGGASEPAPAASLFAVPRGGARQRLLAVAPEPADAPGSDLTPPAGEPVASGESVLFSKGDASASGFRPWYWSYERDGSPPPSDAGSVTPFPASAPSPVSPPDPVSAPATSSETSPRPARRRRLAVAAGVALAVAAGAGVFFLPARPVQHVAAPVPVALAPPPQAPTESAPPPAAAEPKPPPAVAPQEMVELMARGNQMLATGDIAAARLFFERAAEAGNAAAATAAGKTYDPLFLAEAHARGIRGDPVAAARWYRQASAGGDRDADGLMKRLMAKYAG